MRELKFRVWSKSNNCFLINETNAEPSIYFDIWDWTEKMSTCLTFPTQDYIFQQYTGLNDKNGKEVYEDDIINTKVNRYVIEYDDNKAEYIARGLFHSKDIEKASSIIHNGILLGNIFDNPELLNI